MSALESLFGVEPGPLDGLPVDHLSPSSIDSLWKCAEAWRRDKVGREPRPATAATIFGTAFHRAVEHNMRAKVESHEDMPVDEMRDLAGDSFNTVLEEEKGEREIVWREEKPNIVQQQVVTAMVGNDDLPGFHQVLAPLVQPVSVERWVEIPTKAGVPLRMRLDIEDDQGGIRDVKTTKRAKTQADLDKDTQPAAYLYGRAAEGNPATGFGLMVAIRTVKPQQQELLTVRSEAQLARFESLVDATVDAIRHYMTTYGPDGPWPPAPPLAFWCGVKTCSYYPTCVWRGGAA